MGKNAQTVHASNGNEKSWLYRLGCNASAWVSDLSAHPYAQMAVLLICIAWFALGLATDLLTAALSILAISLSQMVLNRQNEREAEARRRDIAMHVKLDELIVSVRHAHNELAGIEDLPQEVIEELREQTLENAAGDERATEMQRPAQKGRTDSPA